MLLRKNWGSPAGKPWLEICFNLVEDNSHLVEDLS
jgi:hypothetical protein